MRGLNYLDQFPISTTEIQVVFAYHPAHLADVFEKSYSMSIYLVCCRFLLVPFGSLIENPRVRVSLDYTLLCPSATPTN
jgi:hypothetical protein